MGCNLNVTEKDLRDIVASLAHELAKLSTPGQREMLAKFEAECRTLNPERMSQNFRAWVQLAKERSADPNSHYSRSAKDIGTLAHKSGLLQDWAMKSFPDAVSIQHEVWNTTGDGKSGEADLVVDHGDGTATVVEFFTGSGQANYKVDQVVSYGAGSLRETYSEMAHIVFTLHSYDDALQAHADELDVEIVSPLGSHEKDD